tara:strand:+ start:27770 stop:28855 length:1086 start_codon:yes stop_codon:yes gene_type:complete
VEPSTASLTTFLDYLKLLVRQPSVVGYEEPFFRLIRRELEEMGIKISLYQGLLVAEGSKPTSNYLSAHVDRHGLICTGPNEFQYAAFVTQNRSELNGNSVSEQTLEKIADRFEGQQVHAYEPWSGTYLGQGTTRHSYISEKRKNLIIEINGLEHVTPGVPIAYSDRISIHEGRVSAQLDNVLMVAVVVYLFSQGYQGTAFFTAQEEAGRSWRYLADWFYRVEQATKKLIVLDTSPFGEDEKEASDSEIILRHKDATADFDEKMVAEIAAASEKLGIKTVYKDIFIEHHNEQRLVDGKKPLSLGRTELGRIIEGTDGLISGATIQIPTTGYHTSEETASLQSIAMAINLLKEVLKESFEQNK